MNRYLTLGTVGLNGRLWTSPAYFASEGERVFYWVSATKARRSRNLAERQQVSIVVCDSHVAPHRGRAVYVVGECPRAGRPRPRGGLDVYPGPKPSPYRLYRATASDL